MRPATYVMRSTGCGRFLGIVLIAVGLVVLLANSGLGIPTGYTKWWPLIVIALGVYLLLRHYWNRLAGRPQVPAVVDVGMGRQWRRPGHLSPPGLPVLIIAIGLWRLALNLHWTSTWVLVAVILIALGALFLAGSLRAGVSRS